MATLDWRELSGPRVSRRTLMKFAAATGAVGFASWLAACGGDDDDGDEAAEVSGSGGGEPSPTAAGTAPGTAPAGAAATTASTGEGKPGGTLHFAFGIDQIPTLDPAQSHSSTVAGDLIANLFSSLVQFDEQLGLVPDLAEDWDVSADGTIYTFHLREGLTFHNGDPLVAEDFVYTYERTINPDFASAHAYKLELIEEITATDELTLTCTMSEPFAPFLAVACVRGPGRALTPISRRAIEEMGDEQFGLTPVGCGPFMIVPESAEVGQGFDMVAYEDWYGGRPFLDQITVTLIPEPSSQVSALEAGDVDMLAHLAANGVEQVQSNDELVIVDAPGTNWRSLSINSQRPPWDNLSARMAVSKAIDRDDYIERVFFGLATPCIGPIQPAFGWAYLPPEEVDNPQAFDFEEAKRLAEEAGLDGVQPVLITTSADQREAEVFRLILQDIGLDVQLDLLQNTVHTEREEGGDFDFSLWGSGGDADPDDAFWNFFHSTGARAVHGLKNPQVDELLQGTRTSIDQAERARMFQEVQAILQAEVPCAFTRHVPDRTAFYDYVKGYRPIAEVRYLESVWLDQ
jgi:peptide/nickel transport system substrate-binding protein